MAFDADALPSTSGVRNRYGLRRRYVLFMLSEEADMTGTAIKFGLDELDLRVLSH